jgi:23S rRNA (guanosine2251-2'-O)-methyltransferase
MLLYGLNPVLEALRAGRVMSVRVSSRDDRRMREVVSLASRLGVPIERVEWPVLDRVTSGAAHQGVVAVCEEPEKYGVADLIRQSRGVPLVVVLDGVEDPQNVGAILRSVDAAGADGVVRQTRHAAPLEGAAAKASAGAVAHVRIAEVVNIARALDDLKDLGVWTVGLAGDAPILYTEIDFRQPTAVVLGAEGTGLRRLVRQRCDWLAALPMRGHVESLNVAVAAGIVLFVAVRQRKAASGSPAGR